MIVWLASYPRSGNNLLRQALNCYYGCKSVSQYAPEAPTEAEIASGKLSPPMPFNLYFKVDESVHGASAERYFVKTHNPPHEHKFPALYVVRDGRDALVSYAHYAFGMNAQKKPDSPEYQAMLRNLILETRSPFGQWGENVTRWVARPNTAVLRFEDLLARPQLELEKALSLIQLKLQPCTGTPLDFKQLHQFNPFTFRRGQVGSWRDEMPPDLEVLFWKHHGAVMEKLGYPR